MVECKVQNSRIIAWPGLWRAIAEVDSRIAVLCGRAGGAQQGTGEQHSAPVVCATVKKASECTLLLTGPAYPKPRAADRARLPNFILLRKDDKRSGQ